MKPPMKSCASCAHFFVLKFIERNAMRLASGDTMESITERRTSECRRYPRYEKRQESDWCGEYKKGKA